MLQGTCNNYVDIGDWDCECVNGYEFINGTGCKGNSLQNNTLEVCNNSDYLHC